ISAMLAAAAGCLSAHLTRTIAPNGYGFNQAVSILAFAVLGGTGRWVGGIVGGVGLTGLPGVLRFTGPYRGVVNGLILLLVIVYLRGGLVNPAGWLTLWGRIRSARRRAVESAASS